MIQLSTQKATVSNNVSNAIPEMGRWMTAALLGTVPAAGPAE